MKTWFITGIGRGLGKALAQAALARGDTVVGTTRGDTPAIDAATGALHALTLDITDPAAIGPVVQAAFERAPTIDVVVNNAGYGLLGAIEDASDAEVERLLAVNLLGPFRLIRTFLPRLRAQGHGHIVNVTSIAGRAPMASSGMYAAAKFAMEGLSQSLAQEVAPLGLRVTAVAPGGLRTDFLSDHSIRRSNGVAPEVYAASVGKALDHLEAIAGRQAGDPARGAAAILAAVDAETPPLQLLLGSDALRRARQRLDETVAEIAAWEAITLSSDFPKGE